MGSSCDAYLQQEEQVSSWEDSGSQDSCGQGNQTHACNSSSDVHWQQEEQASNCEDSIRWDSRGEGTRACDSHTDAHGHAVWQPEEQIIEREDSSYIHAGGHSFKIWPIAQQV